jgi:hypothetical protein
VKPISWTPAVIAIGGDVIRSSIATRDAKMSSELC